MNCERDVTLDYAIGNSAERALRVAPGEQQPTPQSCGEANICANRQTMSREEFNEARAMRELNRDGFTIIPNAFSETSISLFKKEHEKYWKAFKNALVRNTNGVGYFRGQTVSFLEKGRYDLELDFGIFRTRRLLQNSTIMSIVNRTLKRNYIAYAGSLPSVPNSLDGSWHRDVYSLFDNEKLETRLPIFYLTVLIPLADIDSSNGATEFMVGSHKGRMSGKHVIAEAKAGSAIVCSGMIYHRGRANKSDRERHILYVVYCKKWYNDYV